MTETELAQKVWDWAMPWLAYIGAARIVMKPIAARLAKGVEQAIVKSKETRSKDDDRLVESIISSRAYLVVAWVLDYLVSVKLPMNGYDKKTG